MYDKSGGKSIISSINFDIDPKMYDKSGSRSTIVTKLGLYLVQLGGSSYTTS
jgi:hypothetical protein